MKIRILVLLLLSTFMIACVSIPKETVVLSKTLGNDLEILHNSHQNLVKIYFDKIKSDINTFIDDVYAPFVINYVLKKDFKNFKDGKQSLYGSINAAGKSNEKKVTDAALEKMSKFQKAALKQISFKRNELLKPIIKQENEILSKIDKSYDNVIYANATITGYLESIRKVKEAQKEALSLIGLKGFDTQVSSTLIKMSELINDAIIEGKKIDKKSDNAIEQINAIVNKIKNITTKN